MINTYLFLPLFATATKIVPRFLPATIYDELLQDYDKRDPPLNAVSVGVDGSTMQITHVEYLIELQFLDEMKPIDDMFGIAIGFYQEWYDARFERNGSSVVQLKAKNVWIPQSYFYGFIKPVLFQSWEEQSVTIYSSGRVIMTQQLQYSGHCLVTAEFFPYDVHQCFIAIQNPHHNVLLTPLQEPVIFPEMSSSHPSWWISKSAIMNHSYIGTSADGLEKLAVGSNGNFEHIRLDHPTVIGRGKQEIRVQIELVRKPSHALTNVLLPIYILAGMACFSFLVPADGGERMGFVITILLGLIFSGIMIEQQAAQSGDNSSPKILNVVYYVYAISFCSLIAAICMLYGKGQCNGTWILAFINWLQEPWCNYCGEDETTKPYYDPRNMPLEENLIKIIDAILFSITALITIIYIAVLQHQMIAQYPDRAQ